MKHYKALQGRAKNEWYVYDNYKDQIVKPVATRAEARRIAVGMNAGWIREDGDPRTNQTTGDFE